MSNIICKNKFEYMLHTEHESRVIHVEADTREQAKYFLEKIRFTGLFEFRYIGRVKDDESWNKQFKKAKFRRY